MRLHAFMLFATVLFGIGLYGALARKNLIGVLIGIELMLNAANLNFLAFGHFRATGLITPSTTAQTGQIVALFVMGLAAAEVTIALSIILAVRREHASIAADALDDLKG